MNPLSWVKSCLNALVPLHTAGSRKPNSIDAEDFGVRAKYISLMESITLMLTNTRFTKTFALQHDLVDHINTLEQFKDLVITQIIMASESEIDLCKQARSFTYPRRGGSLDISRRLSSGME